MKTKLISTTLCSILMASSSFGFHGLLNYNRCMYASTNYDKKLVATERDDTVALDKLQDLLSDLHLVYSHLHNFHWNVEGPHFLEYHEHLQSM